MVLDKKDAHRMNVIEQVNAGLINNQEAAQALGLNPRSIQRLKRKASASGIKAVWHGNRGKRPHNAIDIQIKKRILELAHSDLEGYNDSHMADVLEEDYDIKLSRSSIQKILQEAGIPSHQQKRRKRTIHRSRERRNCRGELVQFDASQHDWLSNGGYLHLHASLDDATSELLGLYFEKEETLAGYTECIRQMNKDYGLPESCSTDGRTVFHYNANTRASCTFWTSRHIKQSQNRKQKSLFVTAAKSVSGS